MLPGVLELSKASTSLMLREELQITMLDEIMKFRVWEIEYIKDPIGDEKSLRFEFTTST